MPFHQGLTKFSDVPMYIHHDLEIAMHAFCLFTSTNYTPLPLWKGFGWNQDHSTERSTTWQWFRKFFHKVIVWQQMATFPLSYAQTILFAISQELPIILILCWTKKKKKISSYTWQEFINKYAYPSAPELIQWLLRSLYIFTDKTFVSRVPKQTSLNLHNFE